MSTQPANDQLSAFLDGELEDAEAAHVQAALEADADLRAEFGKLKAVQRLLRSHGPARAPEGFADRVLAKAAEQDTVVAFPWWRRPFGIPVEGVLVAAAAALVLIVALPRGGDSTAPPPSTAPAAAVEDKAPAAANPVAPDAIADAAPAQGEGIADANLAEGRGLGAKGNGYGGGGAVKGSTGGTAEGSAMGLAGTEAKDANPKPAPTALAGTDDAGDAGVDTTAGIGSGSMDNAALPEVAPASAAPGTKGQGTDVADPTMTASGLAITLYSEDEEILGTLQVLAARHGGVIRDMSGALIKKGVLEQQDTQIYADVPADQASAFSKALENISARVESTGNSTITSGSSIKVPIRVVWTMNAPSTKQGPANAARSKQKMEADYEAADEMVDQRF